MALYGINAYMSNSYAGMMMNNLFSFGNGKNGSSSNNIMDLIKTDRNTGLDELMRKVAISKTKGFQKTGLAEFSKAFSPADNAEQKKNEENLAAAAKDLAKSSSALAVGKTDAVSDPDKALEGLKAYVGDYNSVIDNLEKTGSSYALSKGQSMKDATGAYSKTLAKVGIMAGADGKLSIDEEKFKNADKNLVNSLFSGNYSYANKISDKAGAIGKAASLQSQLSYNKNGALNYYNLSNSVFDSYYSKAV